MAGARAPDTSYVASARHAYTVIRRHALHAAVCSALLALCVCCCALASTAPAATLAQPPHASDASSHASAPAKRRTRRAGCARRASFHSTGGGTRRHARPRAGRRAPCRTRGHARRHAAKRRIAKRHAAKPGGGAPQTPAASGACANAQLQPNAANLELVRAATLCLVNRERTSRGEAALKPDADLQRAAQAHSSDMASSDYFAHDSRNGATPLARMRAAGYIFSSHLGYAVGENIAWATLWLATPKAIVAGWMASPGHRANILDATFRDTGVGVAPHPLAALARGQAGAIYTQDFGRIIAP